MAPVNLHYIRSSINDWASRSQQSHASPTSSHSAGAAPQTQTIYREVQSGESIILDGYYELNPNYCGALSAPRVLITQEPILGKVTEITQDQLFARYRDNCHTNAPVVNIRYEAGEVEKEKIDTFSWTVNFQSEPSLMVKAIMNIKSNIIPNDKNEEL